MNKPIIVIGYSGHSYVVIDILKLMGATVTGYCDNEQKESNPFGLQYFGQESGLKDELKEYTFFPAIGLNKVRRKICDFLVQHHASLVNAIHPRSVIASSAVLGDGILVAAGAVINPLVTIGRGVVCNTSSVIEHECIIGDYSFIAPGAVLCGNVTTGTNCFIGANSVIKQGLNIGNDVTIGAGSVVLRDLPDGSQVMGNPAK